MSNRDSGFLPVIAGALLLMIGLAAFGGVMWYRAQQAEALLVEQMRAVEAAKTAAAQAARQAAESIESIDVANSPDVSNDEVVTDPNVETMEVDHKAEDNGFLLFPPAVEAAMMGEAQQRRSGGIIKSLGIELEPTETIELRDSNSDLESTIESE